MRFNRAADLRAFDDVFIHIANGLAQSHFFGVAKLNVLKVRRAVNSVNGIALVQLPFAGEQKQIISRFDGQRLSGNRAVLAFTSISIFARKPLSFDTESRRT